MADAPDSAVVTPTHTATVPAQVNRVQAAVGTTAIAGGALTSVDNILGWCFQCIKDGIHLVIPDQPTLGSMALAIILIGHGLKKIRWTKAKRTRASDSTPSESIPSPTQGSKL